MSASPPEKDINLRSVGERRETVCEVTGAAAARNCVLLSYSSFHVANYLLPLISMFSLPLCVSQSVSQSRQSAYFVTRLYCTADWLLVTRLHTFLWHK